jgi:hypothetical protein
VVKICNVCGKPATVLDILSMMSGTATNMLSSTKYTLVQTEISPQKKRKRERMPKSNPILRSYRLDFVECRGLGHEWHKIPGFVDHRTYGTVKGKQAECSECGAVRYRWYLSTGQRFGPPTYEHPEGYSLRLRDFPNADRLPSAAEWRGIHFKREGFKTPSNVRPIKKPRRKTA